MIWDSAYLIKSVIVVAVWQIKKYYKKKCLTIVKMNLDESLNKKITKEENNQQFYEIPGKIKLGESEKAEREQKLKSLAENWKKERIMREESSKQLFGFTKNSEILNGRLAMFFLATGLLTEIWTKQTIIGQIDTMVRIVGLI